MVILGSLGSVESVAWGYALGTAISWPLALFWISRESDSPVMRMFLNGLRAILAYGLASIVGFFVSDSLTDQLHIVQCIAGGCAILVVLGLEYLVWPAYRRDVLQIVKFGCGLVHGTSPSMGRRNRWPATCCCFARIPDPLSAGAVGEDLFAQLRPAESCVSTRIRDIRRASGQR